MTPSSEVTPEMIEAALQAECLADGHWTDAVTEGVAIIYRARMERALTAALATRAKDQPIALDEVDDLADDHDEIDDVIARLEVSDPEAASYLKATDRELAGEREENDKLRSALAAKDQPIALDEVERVARAICMAGGQDPDSLDVMAICDRDNQPLPLWNAFEDEARAAIAALIRQPVTGEVREALEEVRLLIGLHGQNERLSVAQREGNLNKAWHLLNAALSSIGCS